MGHNCASFRGFRIPEDESCIIALSNKTSGGSIDKEAILAVLYGGLPAKEAVEE